MGMGLGSLTGTLEGDKAILAYQALQQQQQEELAQRAQGLQGQAQQAGDAYSQAAAAPPPQLDPMSALLTSLGGGFGSILEGNQGPNQRAQQSLETSKAAQIKARADNLQSLRDVYSQKAEEAQKAGDLETTEKYRRQFELSSKQLDIVMGQQKRQQAIEDKQAELKAQHENRLGEIAASGAQARLTAAAKSKQDAIEAGGAQNDALDNEVKQTVSGRNYLPLTNIKGVKATAAALQYAKAHNMPAIDAKLSGGLDRLDVARNNLASMAESQALILPKDWKDVQKMAANKFADATGSDPEVRAYREYVSSVIEQFVALLAGAPGMRLNKSEIDRIIKAAPTITTPLPAAEKWVERVHQLIDNTEAPILKRPGLGKPTPAATSQTFSVTAPNGKTYQFTSQEKADAFKARIK